MKKNSYKNKTRIFTKSPSDPFIRNFFNNDDIHKIKPQVLGGTPKISDVRLLQLLNNGIKFIRLFFPDIYSLTPGKSDEKSLFESISKHTHALKEELQILLRKYGGDTYEYLQIFSIKENKYINTDGYLDSLIEQLEQLHCGIAKTIDIVTGKKGWDVYLISTANNEELRKTLNNINPQKLLNEKILLVLKSIKCKTAHFYAYDTNNNAKWFSAQCNKLPKNFVKFPKITGEVIVIQHDGKRKKDIKKILNFIKSQKYHIQKKSKKTGNQSKAQIAAFIDYLIEVYEEATGKNANENFSCPKVTQTTTRQPYRGQFYDFVILVFMIIEEKVKSQFSNITNPFEIELIKQSYALPKHIERVLKQHKRNVE